ncbi:MAG: hypothetical protein FWG32_09885, partial [Oscillospiraceae bacterium]|nr:hypothetical protein [Oscillospiraceae bacterium]
MAKEHGLRLTLFGGSNMTVAGISARGYISGDRVFVRADHPDFTAAQIMNHEAGHHLIDTGKIDPDETRDRIDRLYGREMLAELSRKYMEAYLGARMTEPQIFKEVICDSLGDMNIFAGTEYADDAEEALLLIKDAVLDGMSAQNAAATARTTGPPEKQPEGKFSFQGYDPETGKGRYKSNFPLGTPKTEKAKQIFKLVQDMWAGKPIDLVITEQNGNKRTIQARFDPYYSETEYSDLRKLMGGNRHGTAGGRRVALDLADDYYQIIQDSSHDFSIPEKGKEGEQHKDVKEWHYFINDILFSEHGSDTETPYRISIDVKERDDGSFVYNFAARKQNIKDMNTPDMLAGDAGSYETATYSRLDTKVPQDAGEVKGNFSMEPSPDYEKLNARLQRKLEATKAQFKRTERPSVRQEDTDKLARRVLKDYVSALKPAELYADMKALGDYIVTPDASYAEALGKATDIARDVVNNAEVLVENDEAQTFKAIRSHVGGQTISMNKMYEKDLTPYDSFEKFRRHNFGRFHPTTDLSKGTPVDTVYEELTRRFGEAYFPSDITAPPDQMMQISDVF